MNQQVALPAPFSHLAGKVQGVHQTGPTEYHSSCPECGSHGHKGNDYPDRFMIFTDGHPRAYCRRCGLFMWADEADPSKEPPSKDELDAWRKEQIAREEARKRSADLALRNLRDSARWEAYYAQLDTNGRQYWRSRGIPNGWQDFLQLGWNPQSRWGPPTATIPLFDANWDVLNIKHRLIGDSVSGKYRYELHGLPPPLFRTDPSADLSGHVVAVEGEIKAAVVKVTLDDSTPVVGLPGATPPQSVTDELQQAEQVTLVMDPGAELETQRLVDMLGRKRCRVLVPGMKIDDGIMAAGMTGRELRMLLATAGRA